MKCPACDSATHVLETRETRRRRRCLTCDHRFTTIEVLAETPDMPSAPRPKPKAEAPVPGQKLLMTTQERARARAEARRKIEENRDTARITRDDWFSSDNDYLPEV